MISADIRVFCPTRSLKLYDLSIDPWESKDVATEYPDVIARMEQGMAREHQSSAEYPDGKNAHPSSSVVD